MSTIKQQEKLIKEGIPFYLEKGEIILMSDFDKDAPREIVKEGKSTILYQGSVGLGTIHFQQPMSNFDAIHFTMRSRLNRLGALFLPIASIRYGGEIWEINMRDGSSGNGGIQIVPINSTSVSIENWNGSITFVRGISY